MSTKSSDTFAKRLRLARGERGLSQEALATRAKFNPSAISHFETGNRKPSFDNLRRLAVALDVTTDFLLGKADQMAATPESSDQLFRDFSSLTSEDQEFARDFMKNLAKRSKKQRREKDE